MESFIDPLHCDKEKSPARMSLLFSSCVALLLFVFFRRLNQYCSCSMLIGRISLRTTQRTVSSQGGWVRLPLYIMYLLITFLFIMSSKKEKEREPFLSRTSLQSFKNWFSSVVCSLNNWANIRVLNPSSLYPSSSLKTIWTSASYNTPSILCSEGM